MVTTSPSERLGGAVGAGLVAFAALYLLIAGLVVRLPGIAALKQDLVSFIPPPPSPEPKIDTRPRQSKKSEGKAAPPNIVSKATEVTAPVTPPPPVPPPPTPAAPKPFQGDQSSQGAALTRGPGTGAGGVGNGTGSGDNGDGDGDGDYTPPRQVGGKLRMSDIPDDVRDSGVRGVVGVRYFVTPDGRATDCRVTRRSGSALLDATTCRLIEERFRFKPSLGPDGRPVGSYIVQNHYWFTDDPRGRDDDDR